jgi:tyrosyl-tRNA synthetase
MTIMKELQARELIAGNTDIVELESQLSSPTTFYGGFDPTADSLHVGHLVPILALKRLKNVGHNPLIVIGGATALIGDPSGKNTARKILTKVEVFQNTLRIGNQITKIIGEAKVLNNYDWMKDLSWIDVLRDIGVHFSINKMLSMDSVNNRLEGGLSFLEFNYMILQAYDFAHLYKHYNCRLQIGGSDQWGNMVMGIDLARKLYNTSLCALTLPLATKSDGGKFGKTESGTIWLDSQKTSLHDFFQFWRNVSDSDVKKFLKMFTFKSIEEIDELTSKGGLELNKAKEELAFEVTSIVHGEENAIIEREYTKKLFVEHNYENMKSYNVTDTDLLNILITVGATDSKGAGRRLIEGNAIKWNEKAITEPIKLSPEDFPGILKVGKKKVFKIVFN